MKRFQIVIAATFSLALAACGPSEAPQEQAGAPAQPSMVDKAVDAAKDAAQVTQETAGEAVEAAKNAASDAMDKGKEITARAVEKTREIAGAAGDKSAEMIEQIKTYIAENEPEMAKSVLDRLAQMKDGLSESAKAELAKLDAMMSGGEPTMTPAAATTPPPPETSPAGN